MASRRSKRDPRVVTTERWLEIRQTLHRIPFDEIEAALRKNTGPPRQVPIRALIGGLLIEGSYAGHSFILNNVALTLFHLSARRKKHLGIPCHLTEAQLRASFYKSFTDLETALRDGFVIAINGEHLCIDAHALGNLIVDASIPLDLPHSRSLAVDGTAVKSWAKYQVPPDEIILDGAADDAEDDLP
jgi:hypothetical protein